MARNPAPHPSPPRPWFWVVVITLAAATSHALAQTATVSVSHDHPTGLLQPGETIRLTWQVDWEGGFQFARIAGDAVATPDVGTAGPGSGNVGVGPFINFGLPMAGSVRNVDVGSAFWPGFTFSLLFTLSPILFLEYDWTAPVMPGTVEFSWVPSPSLPEPLVYPSFLSLQTAPLTTTYLGTSITVIPAPASAAALFLAGAIVFRRRRRP